MGTQKIGSDLDGAHNLRIEQHGVEPWGDQYEVLYDFTGFYSSIFDVAFNSNCTVAIAFMQTKNQIKSKGGFMPLITYLNLVDPNFDEESVLMIEKLYSVGRYRSEDSMPTML